MGNCYSAESNASIETNLTSKTVNRQKVDFSSADQLVDSAVSVDTIDIEG